jgi:drug/metabolite transporter (DMT)-like permease
MYTFGPSLYYRALKGLPISESTILYSLVGIYALILGSILGTETFQISRLIGGIILIAGIVLISLKKGKFKIDKNLLLMIAATFLYAIGALTDDLIISHHYFSTLFFQLINFSIGGFLIVFINPGTMKHVKKMYTRKTYPLIFLNAGFIFVSYFLIFTAYSLGGQASQITLVLSTETIAMVLFAALFLKERDRLPLKVLAACLAAVGIYLIA